jgi:uncharacterized protein
VVDSLEKKFSKDSAARMANADPALRNQLAKYSGKTKADTLARNKIADSIAKKTGDTLTKKQSDEKKAWEGIAKKFKYEAKNDSANIKAIQITTYGKLWDHLVPQIQGRESRWFYRNGVWEFAAIMLLGMFLFKLGFFTGRFSQKQYFMMVLLGIGLGLLCGWFRLYFQSVAILDYTKYVKTKNIPYTILWPIERAFMIFGIAAKIMWVIQFNMFKRVTETLADVGRLALTNYLLQSIFFSILFYGYGMGYFARIGQFKLYFLVTEVILVQVIFSVFWMRYFYSGPAEWLLRSLMYKKKIPFSRKPDETILNQDESLNAVI